MNDKDITIALRYLPVVNYLSELNEAKINLLEVGSGSYGICPYLDSKIQITGVDVDFDKDTHDQLTPVRASATKLPFIDKFFDIVISMDTLEHLSPIDRKQAIKEMLRVAKKSLIIGFPTGYFAYKIDKFFNWYYTLTHGQDSNFLTEHLKFPLPQTTEIVNQITKLSEDKSTKRDIKVINNTNILVLLILLLMGFSQNKYLCRLFRYSIALLPILRFFNFPPAYRQLIFIDLKGDENERY